MARPPEATPRARAARLAAAVAAAAVALMLAVPGREVAAHGAVVAPVAGLVLVAIVASERLVFRIESRNEAVSFSPTDVPLALGIILLPPPMVVAVRVLGGAIGLLIWRRQPLFKFLTNLTSFTIEAVVAILCFRLLVGVHPAPSLSMWVALVGSMLVALVAGGLLIATAISFFEHDFAQRVAREISHSYLFYLPGALLGASAAVSLLVEPWMIAIGLVPAPAIWSVLRSHGALMHRFSDLRHIHEFSSQVGRPALLEEIADLAVREIAQHLRAASVDLAVLDGPHAVIARAHVGRRGLLDEIGIPELAGAVPERPLHVQPGDSSALAARVASLGLRDVIVVAIEDDHRVCAALAVAERCGAADTFTVDDCERLVPITQQLAVALAKGRLHLEVQHQATHDALTGLPNRAYFEAWTDEQIRARRSVALLLLDLDRFKEVNDTLGHHVGDVLLAEAAQRIAGCLAPRDTLARLGGDEFAIVSPDAGVAEAELLAERVSVAIEQPFELGHTTLAIAASIGIALSPEHAGDRATLLRRADLAMYEAKRLHTRSVLFSDQLQGIDSVRLALLGALRDAIRTGALEVHYQPKLSLDAGRVVGVEALARWAHPVHGDVRPDVFVPMAEQAGLIGEMTDLVLARALAAAARWSASGRRLGVAVNISPQSLLDENLPDAVARHLSNHGLAPGLLTLEITEDSVMSDAPRLWRILERLDRLGVNLAVDDFGTGHSSLVNLRRLPVSEIKIDRGFVRHMAVEPNDEVIVRSIVDLAHNLGLRAVAEGVETADVLEMLRAIGCDVAQGYGISVPLAPADFEAWLSTRPDRPDGAGRARLLALGHGSRQRAAS